jgi:hypothetical protein
MPRIAYTLASDDMQHHQCHIVVLRSACCECDRLKSSSRSVKKFQRPKDKHRMIVRFDEDNTSGAPVSVRDRDGESAASAAE